MSNRTFTQDENIVVNPGWGHFEKFTFAPAIRRGNLLFVSGMTASDEDGRIVGDGDIVEQTRYVFEKLRMILDAVGARPSDVVKTTDFITTTENYAATSGVRREFFGESFPASTGVVVSGLLRSGALIEIEAIVALRDDGGGTDTHG